MAARKYARKQAFKSPAFLDTIKRLNDAGLKKEIALIGGLATEAYG